MKQGKNIVIFGGGILDSIFLEALSGDEYVIGVDQGAHWLLAHGVVPDIAIGDFDSVSGEELANIKKKIQQVNEFPPEKDFTDMELAVEHAIEQSPQDVVIWGGIGSRMDHTVGTMHLLQKFLEKNIPARMRDRTNEVSLLRDRGVIPLSGAYRYVSLLPVTDSIVVTLTGFRYSVSKQKITRGQTMGLSNELSKKEGSIVLHEGVAFVVRSRD